MRNRLLFSWSLLLCLAISTTVCSDAVAQSEELYKVTLLRAAPGNLASLIEETRDYKSTLDDNLIIMRHSQGDHWDLMLLSPVADDPLETMDFGSLVSFQHDFIASSDWTWKSTMAKAENAGLFHIEMFQAVHGQHAALLKEREMENAYLVATGRAANAIFVTKIGSDVDSFTIGFYKDMVEFATDPPLSDEVYHKAATDAGFPSRAEIGTYLRQFLVGHNDTLASHVR
ncbi:MAG: hypothetical protein HKN13_05205 [Rhodothermales bacterium]|nr:hypothetical protein [Rhodothermales bacterium]